MIAWQQLNVGLARPAGDPVPSARALFAALRPTVEALHSSGVLFFFQRKSPDVRLRFGTPAGSDSQAALTQITATLDGLVSAGVVTRWFASPYEPETRKLGGIEVIDAVHRHFDADTRLWLAGQRWGSEAGPIEAPPALVVATIAADCLLTQTLADRDEVWDTWANLAEMTSPPSIETGELLVRALGDLAAALVGPDARREPSPLSAVASGDATTPTWPRAALDHAATAIAELADAYHAAREAGRLRVGLRAVLPFVVQLDLQRWGMGGPDQAAIAQVMMGAWDPANGLRA